jgi:hypothetical protein
MTLPDRYAYSRAPTVTFGSLAALYSAARVFQILPGKLPMVAVVALHVLPLLIFALIHGAILYRPDRHSDLLCNLSRRRKRF